MELLNYLCYMSMKWCAVQDKMLTVILLIEELNFAVNNLVSWK